MIKITIICITTLVIASLSILLSFDFFTQKNNPMNNPEINNNLQQFGIEVIKPNSPEFDVELSKYIGDRNELVLSNKRYCSNDVYFVALSNAEKKTNH